MRVTWTLLERPDLRLDDRVITTGTDPVAEANVGVTRKVRFDLLPVVVVAADAFAIRADRQETLKLFDLGERTFELVDSVRETRLKLDDPRGISHSCAEL